MKMYSLILSALITLMITNTSFVTSNVIPSSNRMMLLKSPTTAGTSSSHSNNNNDNINDNNENNRMIDENRMLIKRSVLDENPSYAGHSIMRFGRAPHNIMHFGKRSYDEDVLNKLQNDLNSMASDTSAIDSSTDDTSTSNKALSSSNIQGPRILLLPVAYYSPYSNSNGLSHLRNNLSKKSADNLESSRGLFMHFGWNR